MHGNEYTPPAAARLQLALPNTIGPILVPVGDISHPVFITGYLVVQQYTR